MAYQVPLAKASLGASKTSILASVQLLTACLAAPFDTSIGCAWRIGYTWPLRRVAGRIQHEPAHKLGCILALLLDGTREPIVCIVLVAN